MKMTKIAFWKKVHENIEEGRVKCPYSCCINILCGTCPYLDRGYLNGDSLCELHDIIQNKHKALTFAKNFIEAHDKKKGKKKSKVDKSTPDHISQENTFLKVAKTIRDRGYYCSNIQCYDCPLIGSEMGCGCGDDTATDEERAFRKRLIDNYISANEPVNTTKVDDGKIHPRKHNGLLIPYEEMGTCPLKSKGTISRPNFRQHLRDKVNMKIRVTPELILELEKICKEEGVYHHKGHNFVEYADRSCLFIDSEGDSGYSVAFSFEDDTWCTYYPETDGLAQIPDIMKTAEPVPAFEQLPEPIRFEDEDKPVTVFVVTQFGIKKKDTTGYRRTIKSSDGTHRDQAIFPSGVRYAMENCYRTFDEAIIVAKMKWRF